MKDGSLAFINATCSLKFKLERCLPLEFSKFQRYFVIPQTTQTLLTQRVPIGQYINCPIARAPLNVDFFGEIYVFRWLDILLTYDREALHRKEDFFTTTNNFFDHHMKTVSGWSSKWRREPMTTLGFQGLLQEEESLTGGDTYPSRELTEEGRRKRLIYFFI